MAAKEATVAPVMVASAWVNPTTDSLKATVADSDPPASTAGAEREIGLCSEMSG